MKKTKLILIIIGASILLCILAFLITEVIKSTTLNNCNIIKSWGVESIVVDGIDVTSKYRRLGIKFSGYKNMLLTPKFKNLSDGNPRTLSRWRLIDKGLTICAIEMMYTELGAFDGTYEIKILNRSRPQKIQLIRDSFIVTLNQRSFSEDDFDIPFDY